MYWLELRYHENATGALYTKRSLIWEKVSVLVGRCSINIEYASTNMWVEYESLICSAVVTLCEDPFGGRDVVDVRLLASDDWPGPRSADEFPLSLVSDAACFGEVSVLNKESFINSRLVRRLPVHITNTAVLHICPLTRSHYIYRLPSLFQHWFSMIKSYANP